MELMLERPNVQFVEFVRAETIVLLMRMRTRRRIKMVHWLGDRRNGQRLNERLQRDALVVAKVSGLLQTIEFPEGGRVERGAIPAPDKHAVRIGGNRPPTGVSDNGSNHPGKALRTIFVALLQKEESLDLQLVDFRQPLDHRGAIEIPSIPLPELSQRCLAATCVQGLGGVAHERDPP